MDADQTNSDQTDLATLAPPTTEEPSPYSLDQAYLQDAQAYAPEAFQPPDEPPQDQTPPPLTGHPKCALKPGEITTIKATFLVHTKGLKRAAAILFVRGFNWNAIAQALGYSTAACACSACTQHKDWPRLLAEEESKRYRNIEYTATRSQEELMLQRVNLNVAQSAGSALLSHVSRRNGSTIKLQMGLDPDSPGTTILHQTLLAQGLLEPAQDAPVLDGTPDAKDAPEA